MRILVFNLPSAAASLILDDDTSTLELVRSGTVVARYAPGDVIVGQGVNSVTAGAVVSAWSGGPCLTPDERAAARRYLATQAA